MKYILYKRFKKLAICGPVNLPAMTECECKNGRIFHNGKILMMETSENAHQYFARNDDGNGMERGKLTQAIQKTLERKDAQHQARWDRVWADERCQKFMREDHPDNWHWNHDFFQADIDELRYIARLVGAKEES